MPTLRYLHYDVFTSRPFEGNQLAVFDDARGVSGADMQRLTNEMNFAESTFVLPAETAGTDIRMRIFTPAREMPMAGHPTVGTTFALADQGVIASGRARWVFGLNIGPIAVALDWDRRPPRHGVDGSGAAGVPAAGHAGGRAARRDQRRSRGVAGRPGGLSKRDRAATPSSTCRWRRARRWTPANPTSRRCVGSAAPSPAGTSACSSSARKDAGDGATVYSRMFAPDAGVVEDPATGSACGPLGGYLVRNGVVPLADAQRIVSAQGVKMGRPSRLHVRVEASAPSDIARVHVGGIGRRVGEGTISW